LIEPFYNWGDMGISYIYRETGFEFGDFALLVTVIAVIAFWVSELIEEKFSFRRMAERSSGLWAFSVFMLIGAVIVMALGRSGSTGYKVVETGIYASEVLKRVEMGEDHIEPEEVARLLLAGQKRIALADLRSREEYDEWHIPGSFHLPVNNAVKILERYRDFDMVVLVSNGSVHPGQAWVVLQIFGYRNVKVMADGLRGFFDRVLKPASLRMEELSESEQNEINHWRTMFLGSGMAVGASSPPDVSSE
jgi:rhodanese-related sulfurtransferase